MTRSMVFAPWFAVTVWPWLAALLLLLTPASRRREAGLTFAVSGALLSGLTFWLLPADDALSVVCSSVAGLVPLLYIWVSPNDMSLRTSLLSFAVIGCALLAFNIRDAFAVSVLCGAGAVLLAWHAGRGAQRALTVWAHTRACLVGVMLCSLGAAWLAPERAQATMETGARMAAGMAPGSVLLAVGLGIMAGLGVSARQDTRHGDVRLNPASLLQTVLRFAIIVLIWRLNTFPTVKYMTLAAGSVTLLIAAWRSRLEEEELLTGLSGLAAIAAAFGVANAIVLFLLVSLGMSVAAQKGREPWRMFLGAGMPPSPVFVALVGMGLVVPFYWMVLMVGLWLPVLVRVEHDHVRALRDPVLCRPDAISSAIMVMGLVGVFLLGWHPVSAWKP